jgi:hypothetical protein
LRLFRGSVTGGPPGEEGANVLHVIVGILAIVIGLWRISCSWYMFRDMLAAILPLALIGFGIVALLAGIRSAKTD